MVVLQDGCTVLAGFVEVQCFQQLAFVLAQHAQEALRDLPLRTVNPDSIPAVESSTCLLHRREAVCRKPKLLPGVLTEGPCRGIVCHTVPFRYARRSGGYGPA